MTPTLHQILRNYGTDVQSMPPDVAAYYLCHRCAGDDRTVRAMRDEIIPAFRKSPVFGPREIREALAAFDARFPLQAAA